MSMLAPSGAAATVAEPVTVRVRKTCGGPCDSARWLPPSANTPTASAAANAIPMPSMRSRPIAIPFTAKPTGVGAPAA